MTGRTFLRGLLLATILLLAGCLQISGETTTIDLGPDGGNVSTSFVGAEGSEERALALDRPGVAAQVIVMVEVRSGDLEVSLLQPDGAVAFVTASRPGAQVTRSGVVRADAAGRIRYRVSARGARDGAFQVFVQI
ncbi:MAG: hypothetical protein N2378_01860 [Chloroflexaceae bacterium]|nr:hypothetical protein [Chloroflexaceae bacterium]